MSIYRELVGWFTDRDHWHGVYGIPHRLIEHVEYTVLTVLVAAAIAIPLGLLIGHTGKFRQAAVSVTGSMRALPTLGLLTWVATWPGSDELLAISVLVVLAVPPILAGAYSGLESIDRQTVDAARAMGMTESQILVRVEIPLALPLIIGGTRSALVQVVATATVAAYPGLGGLGRFIIDGINTSDYPLMFGGAIVVIFLALLFDGLCAVLQRVVSGAHVRLAANSVV